MAIIEFNDEYFMREALKEAKAAFEDGELPIGAVIVANGRVIAKAHNLTERLTDVTAHAEMQAFTAAENYLGGKYLQDCVLFVTLEPCVMCAGASYWTQIGKIVYGAKDEKRGSSIYGNNFLHPKTTIKGGVMEKECADLMTAFFKNKRKENQ